jgi:hypothetical protein
MAQRLDGLPFELLRHAPDSMTRRAEETILHQWHSDRGGGPSSVLVRRADLLPPQKGCSSRHSGVSPSVSAGYSVHGSDGTIGHRDGPSGNVAGNCLIDCLISD